MLQKAQCLRKDPPLRGKVLTVVKKKVVRSCGMGYRSYLNALADISWFSMFYSMCYLFGRLQSVQRRHVTRGQTPDGLSVFTKGHNSLRLKSLILKTYSMFNLFWFYNTENIPSHKYLVKTSKSIFRTTSEMVRNSVLIPSLPIRYLPAEEWL